MRFHKRSPLRPVIYALSAIALTAVIWAMISRNRPQVTDVFPTPDAFAIPAPAPLRLTFDRPMNPGSVEAALVTSPARSGTFAWNENTLTFTPDTPWPRGADISVTLTTAARTSAGLRLAGDYHWTFRTAPTLLAYLWPASRNEPVPAELYVLDPETGEVARLTETETGILDFSLSPDGLFILLSLSNRSGGADVAVLDLLDRTISIIRDCGSELCTSPQFDPSGSRIAFENLTLGQVFIQEGADEPVLVSAGRFPTWSSGGLLFYHPLIEAYVVFDPETGNRTFFPNTTGEPATWAADGSFFLAPSFTEIGAGAFASHILQYFSRSPEPNNLTLERLADDNAPALSPDGSLIAFARRSIASASWTPGRQLWVMRSDGRNAAQLTTKAVYNHTGFTWHPDNAHVAFVRSNQADLNEAPEIWIINIDGSPAIRLVINGFSPYWLP